jgi:hypothetical protein
MVWIAACNSCIACSIHAWVEALTSAIKRILRLGYMISGAVLAVFAFLLVWPGPLFAYSLGTGTDLGASVRPIPPAGGEGLLHGCEKLPESSLLKAEGRRYRIARKHCRARGDKIYCRHARLH